MLAEFRNERIAWERYQETAEKQLLPIFRRALAKSIAPFIAHIEKFGLAGAVPDLYIDRSVWRPAYLQAYKTLGLKTARREFYFQRNRDRALGADKVSAVDFLIDTWTKILRDYALQYTYLIESELNQTTINIINRALGEDYGIDLDRQGGLRLFLKKLKDTFRKRTETIARTESTTISNLGKELGARSWMEQNGGNGYSIWLGRIVGERPTHLAVNDTILPLGEPFTVGGESAERPGDIHLSKKERINCRCTLSFISVYAYQQYVKRGRIRGGKLIGAS